MRNLINLAFLASVASLMMVLTAEQSSAQGDCPTESFPYIFCSNSSIRCSVNPSGECAAKVNPIPNCINVDNFSDAYRYPGSTHPHPILLSTDPPVVGDLSIDTWNLVNLYVDVFEDCTIASSCDGLLASPNTDLDATSSSDVGVVDPAIDASMPCTLNYWNGIQKIKKGPGPGGESSITIDVGNFLTRAHDSAYHAQFDGTLVNAPAGTKLVCICPVDTNSDGDPIIDSGYIYADTLTGCGSDTLGFTFPFLIPPDDYGTHMVWNLILPADSCSDFGNGRRIALHGEVYADSILAPYDSGEFMYAVQSTFIFDTTPPVASNFSLIPIDTSHFVVNLKGTDDTTIVNMGYVRYSINGGPDTTQVLRFQNDSSFGLTTYFQDTLNSVALHAKILIKGFVVNQLGLIDSTSLDSMLHPVSKPSSVKETATEDCQLESVQVDQSQRSVTLVLETMGGPLTVTLIDELGREWQITPSAYLASGLQTITRSLPVLPEGAYFGTYIPISPALRLGSYHLLNPLFRKGVQNEIQTN